MKQLIGELFFSNKNDSRTYIIVPITTIPTLYPHEILVFNKIFI